MGQPDTLVYNRVVIAENEEMDVSKCKSDEEDTT